MREWIQNKWLIAAFQYLLDDPIHNDLSQFNKTSLICPLFFTDRLNVLDYSHFLTIYVNKIYLSIYPRQRRNNGSEYEQNKTQICKTYLGSYPSKVYNLSRISHLYFTNKYEDAVQSIEKELADKMSPSDVEYLNSIKNIKQRL